MTDDRATLIARAIAYHDSMVARFGAEHPRAVMSRVTLANIIAGHPVVTEQKA